MDMRDKQFDNWLKDSLNTEIPLSKQNRQAAWEQIRLQASQAPSTYSDTSEEDFTYLTTPVVVLEALHSRIWRWVTYVITQENTYHKAHANSIHFYRASHNFTGGLTLHSLELMRHRWTCAV